MLQRWIDEVKDATGKTARRTFFVGAVALSLFITTCFLCAAAFVFVFQTYGLVQACLTGAAIFFVVTLISAGSYAALKRGPRRPVAVREDTSQKPAIDPMMLAVGLQLARKIGISRLLPILAIGGAAFGYLMSRQTPAEDDPPE